ncbi:hypothetical protein Tco_0981774 [Tanacetum coccineum]
MEADEDDDPDDIAKIFKIEGSLFDYETPLCKAFNDINYLLKIYTDLFTFHIQGIKTYEEYDLNNNMTGDLKEPWSYNGVPYQLCDHICKPYCSKNGKTKWPTCSSDIDGFCNGGELPGMVKALMHKAKVEESWGDATPGVIKFYAWLKSSFENFHELDHDGPYANIKTEKTYDPYLDFNHIFGRNYGANNVGDTQDCQERKEEHNKHAESSKPTHDPSIYEITTLAFMSYRELIRVMDEGLDRNEDVKNEARRKRYGILTTYTDLAVKESTIWYTLKKMCVELVRAILTPRQHTFAQELKLENHPEKHIREVLRSNSISHFL